MNGRVSVAELAQDLALGKPAVYRMLKLRLIPNIRVGHKFIVTRAAYDAWKQRCGTVSESPTEVLPARSTGVQLQHGYSQT